MAVNVVRQPGSQILDQVERLFDVSQTQRNKLRWKIFNVSIVLTPNILTSEMFVNLLSGETIAIDQF